ncbi:hypothetical protein CJF30_00010869 [Rutstroemia sp. NJR-2017a BBW]|nr:hypothetical protein CJF30_00010869 [Rutstroemia sp. NJR-2017a BBW]
MKEEAKRYICPRTKVLGRNSRIIKSTCKILVSPSRNPVRKHLFDAQVEFHTLPIKKRQLQRKLKNYTKKSRRYLCVFIKKIISEKTYKDRTIYGNDHLYNEVFGFWNHMSFTDKAHVDPTSQSQQPPLPPKPRRRSKTEMEEEYHHPIAE